MLYIYVASVLYCWYGMEIIQASSLPLIQIHISPLPSTTTTIIITTTASFLNAVIVVMDRMVKKQPRPTSGEQQISQPSSHHPTTQAAREQNIRSCVPFVYDPREPPEIGKAGKEAIWHEWKTRGRNLIVALLRYYIRHRVLCDDVVTFRWRGSGSGEN